MSEITGKHRITVNASWRDVIDIFEIFGTRHDVHQKVRKVMSGPPVDQLIETGKYTALDGDTFLDAFIEYFVETNSPLEGLNGKKTEIHNDRPKLEIVQ